MNANYNFEGREADRPIYSNGKAQDDGVIAGSEWLRQRLRQKRLMPMVWMHLYRRKIFLCQNFSFVPRLIHEYVIWTTQTLLRAERVRYDRMPRYHYRIPLRQFTEAQNKKRLQAIIASSVVNAKTLMAFVETETHDTELKQLLRWQAVDGAFSIFHKIGKLSDKCWRNAVSWQQKRRIARNALRALLAGGVS